MMYPFPPNPDASSSSRRALLNLSHRILNDVQRLTGSGKPGQRRLSAVKSWGLTELNFSVANFKNQNSRVEHLNPRTKCSKFGRSSFPVLNVCPLAKHGGTGSSHWATSLTTYFNSVRTVPFQHVLCQNCLCPRYLRICAEWFMRSAAERDGCRRDMWEKHTPC